MVVGPPFAIVSALHPELLDFVGKAIEALAYARNPRLTSWWRSVERNEAVGGHPFSQHLVALGLDVVADNPREFAAAARDAGLIAVVESDHVHLQLWEAGTLERLLRSA